MSSQFEEQFSFVGSCVTRAGETVRRALSFLFSVPIRFYRAAVSPWFAPQCRYFPTCSTYALEALRVHGPIKGGLLAVWRLLRCNPWSHGGVDEVPPRGAWQSEEWVPPEDWAGYDLERVIHIPMGLDFTNSTDSDRHDPLSVSDVYEGGCDIQIKRES